MFVPSLKTQETSAFHLNVCFIHYSTHRMTEGCEIGDSDLQLAGERITVRKTGEKRAKNGRKDHGAPFREAILWSRFDTCMKHDDRLPRQARDSSHGMKKQT
jgi:hypothetical protein